MKDILSITPSYDQINEDYDAYQKELAFRELHLKPLIRFESTELEDLLDMLREIDIIEPPDSEE